MSKSIAITGNGDWSLPHVPTMAIDFTVSWASHVDLTGVGTIDFGGATLRFFGVHVDHETQTQSLVALENGVLAAGLADDQGNARVSSNFSANFEAYLVRVTGYTIPLTLWAGPL